MKHSARLKWIKILNNQKFSFENYIDLIQGWSSEQGLAMFCELWGLKNLLFKITSVKEPINSLLNMPFFKKQFVAICKTIEKLLKQIIKIIVVSKKQLPTIYGDCEKGESWLYFQI